eukprot:12436335-Heterocapsa_arctica.AAC.1
MDCFRRGEYGITTLAPPSVVIDTLSKDKMSTHDGRRILNNGKSTIEALTRLKKEYDASLT